MPADTETVKHFQWVITTLLVIVLAVVGFQAAQIAKLQDAVQKLSEGAASFSASRFTSADGLAVWQKIFEVQQAVARAQDKIDAAFRELDKVDKRISASGR